MLVALIYVAMSANLCDTVRQAFVSLWRPDRVLALPEISRAEIRDRSAKDGLLVSHHIHLLPENLFLVYFT